MFLQIFPLDIILFFLDNPIQEVGMQAHIQKSAVKRLKIAEGHLRKVREMVGEGQYCPEIIQQSTAVQSALRKVDELLLDNHLRECVSQALKAGRGEKEIKELIEAFKKR